jgi:hypothetical protein
MTTISYEMKQIRSIRLSSLEVSIHMEVKKESKKYQLSPLNIIQIPKQIEEYKIVQSVSFFSVKSITRDFN